MHRIRSSAIIALNLKLISVGRRGRLGLPPRYSVDEDAEPGTIRWSSNVLLRVSVGLLDSPGLPWLLAVCKARHYVHHDYKSFVHV